jgi:hypothetical protein
MGLLLLELPALVQLSTCINEQPSCIRNPFLSRTRPHRGVGVASQLEHIEEAFQLSHRPNAGEPNEEALSCRSVLCSSLLGPRVKLCNNCTMVRVVVMKVH